MGYSGAARLGDMYSTQNGRNWDHKAEVLDKDGNAVPARDSFGLVEHDQRVYLIGGENDSGNLNDVWYSQDMIHWYQLQDAPFTGRYGFACFSYDGRLWVVGGTDDTGNLNEVWWTRNGVHWTQEDDAPFAARRYMGYFVNSNKMWVVGGIGAARYNDIWYSADGRNWTRQAASADFSERDSHAMAIYGDTGMGRIVLSGGDEGGSYSDKIWHALNNKYREGADLPNGNLRGHTLTYFDNRLWLIGGIRDAGTFLNEVYHTMGEHVFK